MNKPEIRQCAEFFQNLLREATTDYIELSYGLTFALDYARDNQLRFVWSDVWSDIGDKSRILAMLDKQDNMLISTVTHYVTADDQILSEAMLAYELMHAKDFRNQLEREWE